MESLTGTRALIRVTLRRDRARLAIWIASIAGLVLLVGVFFPFIYPDEESRQSRADLMDNPAARAFTGPGYGLEDYTFGAMMAHEMLGFMAIFSGLMSVFLVVRHTRGEEESRRAELLRSTVLGRHAATASSLVVVCGAHVAIAMVIAVGLPPMHAHYTVAGSASFAASLSAAGILFGGLAVVTAQLTRSGAAASGIGVAVVGTAYVVRAVGDMGLGFISWLSPIGVAQASRAYVDERWWPIGLVLALAVPLIALGVFLSTRRDVDGGLIPERRGPPRASDRLSHPLGLAFRLQRGMLIGWTLGLALFGLAYGTLVNEVERFAEENPLVEEVYATVAGTTFAESFAATMALFFALFAAAFGVYSTLRLRAEESNGLAAPLLATALPRWRWAMSHLTVAMAGSALVLVVTCVAMGITAAITTGESVWVGRMLAASLVHLPVLWLMAGLALAVFGLAPRFAALVWVVLAYAIFEGWLGGLLNFPGWMSDLSPFRHVPLVPAADFAVLPVAVLAGLAVLFIVAGIAAFERRDMAAA